MEFFEDIWLRYGETYRNEMWGRLGDDILRYRRGCRGNVGRIMG